MSTVEHASGLAERVADLPKHWRYAIGRAHRLGWELFPLNDRVRSGQTFRDEEDWSKRPRKRCPECKRRTDPASKGGQGVSRQDCYAECGHRLCHGLLGATSDVDQLIEWAGRFPQANIGLRTGTGSDVLVLDVDGDAGTARLAELVAEHGELPETLRHTTGGGTPHHLFTYPTRNNPAHREGEWRNSAGTLLGAGLDTRGEGGYVVLPGAISRKGPYRIEHNAPLAQPPEWLLELLSTVRRAPAVTPQRRRELAEHPRFDTVTAPNGVHPYAAAAFTRRVEDFRALVGEGNGRTNMLTGGAKYLSGLANARPPSGLTEQVVRDAFAEAAEHNGYAAAHSDWEYQLDRGIEDGRGTQPPNWPPEDPMSEADRLKLDALISRDPDQIEVLDGAFGPGWEESFRARYRDSAVLARIDGTPGTAAAGLPVQAPVAPAEGSAAVPAAEAPAGVDGAGGDDEGGPAVPTMGGSSVDAGPASGTDVDGVPSTVPELAPGTEVDADRMTVVVNGRDFAELRDEIGQVIAITNARDPWLFQHGRNLALAGRTELQPCTPTLLASRLADRCRFVQVKQDAGIPVVKPSDPPRNAIEALHADGVNLGLPEVDRVAHAPFYGPDGTLQRDAGYHAKARTLLIPEPGVTVPEVPLLPTAEQVAAARHLIVAEMLGDFPFADPETADDGPELTPELAGAVALALTPFVRPMIDGPTPLFVIDAPDSRTGKGLLMEVLLRPSWGRGYHVQAAPTSTEEWAKTIVASLRPGPVAAIFDNANARIDSGALASAVTAYPLYTSRILGLSENVHMALPACWVATGNNVVASREIANRVVRSRIDAKMDDPGQRPTSQFRHPNLRRWQTEHMGEIVAAFITLVQAWIADGRPCPADLPTLGGFEDWVSIVGSILAHHGIRGLLANRRDITDTLTDDATDWSGLIQMMLEEISGDGGRDEWTATELVSCMADLRVQAPIDIPPAGGAYAGRRLSVEMRRVRGRRFGNHTLQARTLKGVTRWRLVPV